MEELYVYLPSNSSMDVFPDNTVSCFRVKLRRPLDLKGQFEVALVEISFPTLWQNISEDHCRLAVNTDGTSWREIGVTPGFYATNNDFIRALQVELRSSVGNQRIVHYDSRQRKAALVVPTGVSINLYEGIAQVFGYETAQLLHGGRTYHPPGPFDVNHGVYNLYVYSDLVTYQIVGSAEVPLLSTVSFESFRQDHRPEVITKIFQTPHYIPVNKPFTDTILIEVRDDSGRKLPFIMGKVILKLHFRQRRPPYV